MPAKTLIFIPTYNEHENVEPLCRQLLALGLDADILFIDDNSPDGTGQLLDRLASEHAGVIVKHRTGKLGIGTAHLEGIAWAYDQGYENLVTMDCDFTHSPSDIPKFLEQASDHDVVVGSRYMARGSLPGWSPLRRFLTMFGHFLTKTLLGMSYDATGAFRLYRLDRVPRRLFSRVVSRGYSFFFESLFVIHQNRLRIKEVPIVLPARTYGHSKMSFKDAARSARQVFSLYLANKTSPGQFRVGATAIEVNPALVDPQGWDAYWVRKSRPANFFYELLAAVYRRAVIRRRLNLAIRKNFAPGLALLHAGCGSGQVDTDIQHAMRITAVDISVPALELYARNVEHAAAVRHASIFDLPFADGTFDGIYNLGVVEHFTDEEIQKILAQVRRVLKPGGKVVIFWPHRRATSVAVLRLAHWLLNRVFKRNVQFHPPEISLLKSRSAAAEVIRRAGLEWDSYYFGARDFWVQAVVVAHKPAGAPSP